MDVVWKLAVGDGVFVKGAAPYKGSIFSELNFLIRVTCFLAALLVWLP
jgi:hypothetical protein